MLVESIKVYVRFSRTRCVIFPSLYRHISLLSLVRKIVEHLEKKNFSDEQYVFGQPDPLTRSILLSFPDQ